MRILLSAILVLALPITSDACQWSSREPTPHVTEHTAIPLAVGQQAPELSVSTWLHGEGTCAHKPGQITLMVWQRARPMLIERIGRLLDLKPATCDVRVILMEWDPPGSGVFEHARKRASRAGLPAWLNIAWEDGSSTTVDYLGDCARRSCEHAVVVDQAGRIAWIGPLALMAQPVSELRAGCWSRTEGPRRLEFFVQRIGAAMAKLAADAPAALVQLDALRAAYPELHGLFLEEHVSAALSAGNMKSFTPLGTLLLKREAGSCCAHTLQRVVAQLLKPSFARDQPNLQLDELARMAQPVVERALGLSEGTHPAKFTRSDCKELLARVHSWQGRRGEALIAMEAASRDYEEVVAEQARTKTSRWQEDKHRNRRRSVLATQVEAYRTEKAAQVR